MTNIKDDTELQYFFSDNIAENLPSELKSARFYQTKFVRYPNSEKLKKILVSVAGYNITKSRMQESNNYCMLQNILPRIDNGEYKLGFEADKRVASGEYKIVGIGIQMTPPKNTILIDFDDCVINGKINEDIQKLLSELSTYTEYSPSRKGLRVIAKTRSTIKKIEGRKNFEYAGITGELSTTEAFTVTGWTLPGYETLGTIGLPELNKIYEDTSQRELDLDNKKEYTDPSSNELEIAKGKIIDSFNANKKLNFWHNGTSGDISEAIWVIVCSAVESLIYKFPEARPDTIAHAASEIYYSPDNALSSVSHHKHDGIEGFVKADALRAYNKTYTNVIRTMNAAKNLKSSTTTPQPVADSDNPFDESPQSDDNYLLILPTDDQGVADCVLRRYGHTFLYTDSHGWLRYTGTHYQSEGAEQALGVAVTETLQARINAAMNAGIVNHGDIIRKSARNHRSVKNAIAQLEYVSHAAISSFDRDPNLLNCANGVVDLRTGNITKHSPNQRFLYCIPTDYVPDADYTKQIEWLESVTTKETAEWLQKAVGYSLTGHTFEEILFYIFGDTRSGKGTFAEVMQQMLGSPFTQAAAFDTFTQKREADTQNFDLAPLKPSRVIIASESKGYDRFNEAKVKQITGGDKIRCAFKHKTHFEYKPQFKIWLFTNNNVNADPDDNAVWGRIRTIHFPHSFLGKEDKRLKQRLSSPESVVGWLAWAVKGAKMWYELGSNGLPELESMAKTKAEHREELDNVGQWLEEVCTVEEGAFSASDEIYRSYKAWCESTGVNAKAKSGLTKALTNKGFERGKEYVFVRNTQNQTTEKVQKRGVKGFRVGGRK